MHRISQASGALSGDDSEIHPDVPGFGQACCEAGLVPMEGDPENTRYLSSIRFWALT